MKKYCLRNILARAETDNKIVATFVVLALFFGVLLFAFVHYLWPNDEKTFGAMALLALVSYIVFTGEEFISKNMIRVVFGFITLVALSAMFGAFVFLLV